MEFFLRGTCIFLDFMYGWPCVFTRDFGSHQLTINQCYGKYCSSIRDRVGRLLCSIRNRQSRYETVLPIDRAHLSVGVSNRPIEPANTPTDTDVNAELSNSRQIALHQLCIVDSSPRECPTAMEDDCNRPISSSSPRSTTPSDIVERWVHLQREMNHQNTSTSESSPVHRIRPIVKSSSRLTKSSPYRQQPVESLTVSFASLLVDQINGAPSKPTSSSSASTSKRGKNYKKTKKKSRFSNTPTVKITIRNNKPVTEIDHVEEWLQQRSAHYAWWRKFVPSNSVCANPTVVAFNRPSSTFPVVTKSLSVNHSQPKQPKAPRCVLWFQFTGNPSKPRPSSCHKTPVSAARMHSIRIEQQPLGGANALVFAADLHLGEDFAIVSRRQPGFTFSLTFFIDGVRHARLSGCCENARNLHVPTRVGGPIGAFVLRSVQGGEQCQVCEKSAPFADPELFTVWPKSHHKQFINSSQECGIERSQDNQHYPSRRRSSLKRAKALSATELAAADVSSQSVDDEQPSSDVLGPGFTSNEDTYEENFYSDVLAPSTEETCQEQQSYEVTATGSQSEVYEEQISSDLFIPFGSVSIEEVFSIASPLRTPHSSPPSFLD